MKSHTLIKRLSTGALLLGVLLPQAPLPAATTDPVGYTTLEPTPSPDGTTRKFTVASFPLTEAPVFAGAITQKPGIEEGDNILTVTDAGWTPDAFGPSGTPSYITHVVVPHTGLAAGRVYPISDNDGSTITIDLPEGVASLGASMESGDQIRVVPVNTLNKLFGANSASLPPRWLSNVAPTGADIVYVWSPITGWTSFYYNSVFNVWNGSSPSPTNLGNFPIFPDEAVWIGRLSTDLPGDGPTDKMKIVVDGSVPVVSSVSVPLSGPTSGRYFTFVSTGYPKDILLNDFQVPAGWVSAPGPDAADVLYIWSDVAGWRAYWRFAGNWVTSNPGNIVGATTTLPANSGVWIGRISSPSNESELFSSVTRPFSP